MRPNPLDIECYLDSDPQATGKYVLYPADRLISNDLCYQSIEDYHPVERSFDDQ